MRANDVASLAKLALEILDRKYETKHSSYVYELPGEVTDREAACEQLFATMDAEAANKTPVLEDHLARNVFQDDVRLKVQRHADAQTRLSAWAKEKAAYLAVSGFGLPMEYPEVFAL